MNYELNESMKQTQKESSRKKPSLWGATFICIGLFIGGPIVLGLLVAVFVVPFIIFTHKSFGELFFSNTMMFVASMLVFPILLFFILLINKKHYHKSYESLGFYKTKWKKKYVFGAGLGIASIVIVYLCNLIVQAVSININHSFNFWILIAMLVGYMIQGMTEEVFFRGFIMNIFSSQKGVVFGIIMSSVFFAIMHIGNPGSQFLAIINIFIFGLVFGLLFYWSNNIWLTGAAHSFWNFTMGSVLGIPVSGQRDVTSIFKTNVFNSKSFINGGTFGLEGGIIVTIFGIILCIVLWKLCQKKGLITKN